MKAMIDQAGETFSLKTPRLEVFAKLSMIGSKSKI